ncbi:hypothetical protein ACNQGB_02005 [Flavobacterium sp. XS1P32]|uniref:tetratricopeptide repeat protein n=1 Tax=Flavobacterium sp. XS1P32 TaxID=3401726 RepID=UPI003AB026E9
MKTAIAIVQNILLPKLEKDSKFSEKKVDSAFWEKFATDLLHFEEDSKPIYASIYSLELADAEKVIAKLPSIYSKFIKELAETYVLGEPSKATEYLVKTNNDAFLKEVRFLQTMQQAIKSVERKRIKADLPNSYDRFTFELSETDMANVIKKKSREDLKEKMKQWDAELVEERETVPVYSMLTDENKNKKETKVISLSWMRYVSIAAILVIGLLVWQPTKNSNEELFANYNSDALSSIDYGKIENTSQNGGVRGAEFLLKNYSKDETEKALNAIGLFQKRDFENSKILLNELNPKDKNSEILFFLAVSQLNTNEVDLAISNLEYLNKIPNFTYANDIQFHLALGYIKQDRSREAKPLLQSLIKKGTSYSKQSSEIIKKMRWI